MFFSHYDATGSEPADWSVPLTPRLQNVGLMTVTVDDQRLLFAVDLLELLDPFQYLLRAYKMAREGLFPRAGREEGE